MFNFKLRPVQEIVPWEHEARKVLHWFALSDGWYWVSAGSSSLFQYTNEILFHWRKEHAPVETSHYVEYEVARFWEDLLGILPAILEPVPQEILDFVGSGSTMQKYRKDAIRYALNLNAENMSEETQNLMETLTAWVDERTLIAGHLQNAPRIWFSSNAEKINLHWDNRGLTDHGAKIWTASHGTHSLPRQEFINAVRSFNDDFLNEMSVRIDEISNGSNHIPDARVDIPDLLKQQQERSKWLEESLLHFRKKKTRWEDLQMNIKKVSHP